MTISKVIKRASLNLGLYRPARKFAGRVSGENRRQQDGLAFYRKLLPPSALCFDVGANIGATSELLLGCGARVVAFEPSPEVWDELRARCAHAANWSLIPAALGAAPSIETLFARRSTAQSSLRQDWEGDPTGMHHVPVLTFDLAVKHFSLPHYVKIDVEGWELEVLKGLSSNPACLSFEFHQTEQDVQKTAACLSVLKRFGPAQVNVTPAEEFRFLWSSWRSLESLSDSFIETIELPNAPYGDVYVRWL